MRSAWESGDAAKAVLSNISFWDMDLTEIQGLEEKVRGYLIDIESLGIRKALEKNF